MVNNIKTKEHGKINVLITMPDPLFREILSKEALNDLKSFAVIKRNETGRNLTSAELSDLLPGVDACMTSWKTPSFDSEVLAHADKLKIIGHAAGSVKILTPPEVLKKGIKVTSAAATIAEGVGEANLASILMLLRNLHRMDIVMKTDGDWAKARKIKCQELHGKKVGIIAASRTGRNLIRLLQPFLCNIVVYDPFLSKENAAKIGVTKVELDELMADSDIISVQAPITPDTHNLVGPRQLSLIKSGAVFTSTARSWVVDSDALLKELQTERFCAALDVFDTEPLPANNPFRGMDNVVLTPHMAGNAIETRGRLGGTIVREFKRFFAGEQLEFEVTEQLLSVMA